MDNSIKMLMDNVAMLILACVLINHMGLILAVEKVLKRELPIINCVKCLSFWVILIYLIINDVEIITAIAAAFISSYIAIWSELLFGFIDVCYDKIYDKIYEGSAENIETCTDNVDTQDSES